VQVKVLTVTERQEAYGGEVFGRLRARGFRAELDVRNEKLGYKIRQAQLEKVPYMLVLGDREAAEGQVAPRSRSQGQIETMTLERFLNSLDEESKAPVSRYGREPGGVL
jgi:threonyl-tRNA synthetase